MKDWVNSAGIRTCGSRDPRYFGSDSRTTQMAGGKGKKKNTNKKRTLFGRTMDLDTLAAANAVHTHLHKPKGRTGCCYSGRSQICRALLQERMHLSGLSRSLALTLNHVCVFFFCVPDHFENLWFYTVFCCGGFSCLFFYVSLLILNRQLTELKFRSLLKGQILKSACMISDHKSNYIGSG